MSPTPGLPPSPSGHAGDMSAAPAPAMRSADNTDAHDHPQDHSATSLAALWRRPLVMAALLAATGLAAGACLPTAGLWAALTAITLGMSAVMWWRKRDRGVRTWLLLAWLATWAAYGVVREFGCTAADVRQYASDRTALVRVTGRVVGQPYLGTAQRGAMGQFARYKPPSTMLFLRAESIEAGRGEVEASGTLLVRIEGADRHIRGGDRVQVLGWLSRPEGPANPGESDFRARLASLGVHVRLSAPGRDNVRILERALPGWSRLWEGQPLATGARQALHVGMAEEPRRLALLEALLLGRRTSDLADLDESFRRVGLSHILSISGAHLTVLVALVWMAVRLVWRHPGWASVAVLAVLAVYMLIVPPQVPIVRAAIMAAVMCVAAGLDREIRAVDLLALAGLAVMAWRPQDLWNPGCQLSFLGVAALMVFARPVSLWLWPDPPPEMIDPEHQHDFRWSRFLCDYLAASLVATLLTWPVVAYHFHVVSPLSLFLSLAAIPVFTVLLWVGFVKVLAGMLLPSVGVVLAGPLEWLADAAMGLVDHASSWPASAVDLSPPPSLAWALGTLTVLVAALSGLFARRRLALGVSLAICVGWLAWPAVVQRARVAGLLAPEPPSLSLHALSVGDGSAFLLQLRGLDPANRAEVWNALFDGGSAQYMDVGLRTVVPALRALGVRRLDAVFISHADIDHFGGLLDVVDALPTVRVLTTPQFLAEAQRDSRAAPAFLLHALTQRGIAVNTITRGWTWTKGSATLEAIWPTEDFHSRRNNDESLVLALRYAGRTLLLTGDVQQEGLEILLRNQWIPRVDVMDLPHHGAVVPASPSLIGVATPSIMLQSAGWRRLQRDPWPGLLRGTGARRYVTGQHGMIGVYISADGTMAVQTPMPAMEQPPLPVTSREDTSDEE